MAIKVSVKYIGIADLWLASNTEALNRWSVMLHAPGIQYMFWSYAVKPTAKQLRRCKKVYRKFILPTIS